MTKGLIKQVESKALFEIEQYQNDLCVKPDNYFILNGIFVALCETGQRFKGRIV